MSIKARVAFAAGLMAASIVGSAQTIEPWRPVSTTLFVLDAQEKGDIRLGANIDSRTNDVAVNLFDFGGKVCHDGEDLPVTDTTPISINGQLVKFKMACINGTRIMQPSSPAGKKFLNAAVASGRPVTLDDGYGRPLHYPGTTLQVVRAKLLSARDAM
ncbi:hypothetical protein [Caballeronia zhejiangensis]|uniref:hypothetical protein n=1 Tax=Caballeronia zhejiangensis TaxID=871203 RepID=UPI00158A5C1C|nr:hypothetical protein [Caballeronia zhejiangensis]